VKILVPIDSSTFSQAATRVAYQLAHGLPDTSLHALHIVNVRPASGNMIKDLTGYVGFEPAVVSEQTYEEHTTGAQSIVDLFVAHAATEGLTATAEVATGAVTSELVRASNSADLVVMGLRGESEDSFPGQGGAQAPNAIPQMATPVLLVPREVTRIKGFAVGYDGSASAVRALHIVSKLAPPLGVPVHLIHVGDAVEGEGLLQQAKAGLPADTVTVFHLIQAGGEGVHKALVDTTEASDADVLVLGFAGQSKIKDVVFGSAQAHLLHKDLHIALLIAH